MELLWPTTRKSSNIGKPLVGGVYQGSQNKGWGAWKAHKEYMFIHLSHISLHACKAHAECVIFLTNRKFPKSLICPRHPATFMKHHPHHSTGPRCHTVHTVPCRTALSLHESAPAAPKSWARHLILLIQWPWMSSNTWTPLSCHRSQGVGGWILWNQHWNLLKSLKPSWLDLWKDKGFALCACFMAKPQNFVSTKLSLTGQCQNLKIMYMLKERRQREFPYSWLTEDFNFLAYSQQSIYPSLWSYKCVIRIPHALIITLVGIKVNPGLYRSLTKHNNWTRNPYVRQ